MTGQADIALKLYAGTERVRFIDASMSCAGQYQESFALIRLFSLASARAQDARASELARVEQEIRELELGIKQKSVEIDGAKLKHKAPDEDGNFQSRIQKRSSQKRKAPIRNDPVAAKIEKRENLMQKLLAVRKNLSSERPVQVFRSVIASHGEEKPLHMPSEQTKFSSTLLQLEPSTQESKLVKTAYGSTPTASMDVGSKSRGQSFSPMADVKPRGSMRKAAAAVVRIQTPPGKSSTLQRKLRG